MQRTKAERAPIVAAIMARRYDMGLATQAKPQAKQLHSASHPWKRAAASGAAEGRAKARARRGRPSVKHALSERAIELRRRGVGYREIAEELGCSLMTVRRMMTEAGLCRKNNMRASRARDTEPVPAG